MRNAWVKISLVFLSLLWGHASTHAQEKNALDSILINYDVFAVSEPLKMEMAFDIKAYRKGKNDAKYLPASLTILGDDQFGDIEKDVRVKARGQSRKAICYFPPMSLNIKKSNVQNEQLKDVKKIKIVTHCRNTKSNQEFVLKEYLIYKIYEHISPYSFRTRLINMKYIDTGKKGKSIHTMAFMIEPEKVMANRLGMYRIKMDHMGMRHCEPSSLDLMAMFNYMIGNADYSVSGRHNVKLLKDPNQLEGQLIPVPYDFDYAGLVDAAYAKPGDNLGIKSVTERYFTGPCRSNAFHQKAIDELVKNKGKIYDEINSFEYISSKSKKKMTNYLNEFFIAVENKNFIDKRILSTCIDLDKL